MLGQRPPRIAGTRVAYLLTKEEEKAGSPVPAYADLVFRYRPHKTIKYYTGRLVCPAEQQGGKKHNIGCSECKLCFTDREIPKRERGHYQAIPSSTERERTSHTPNQCQLVQLN